MGIEGKRIRVEENPIIKERSEIWAGHISNNCVNVILFNRQGKTRDISFTFTEVGFVGKAVIRNLV